jgi:hypothetical protein
MNHKKEDVMKMSRLGKIAMVVVISVSLTSGGSLFAGEAPKPKAPVKQPNMNQVAFIAKHDKNGDGKVDNKEFPREHFQTYDKNGDGFIEPLEAPEGATAY